MSVVLISLATWRGAALAVWVVLAVGVIEIVTHILRAQPHRASAKRSAGRKHAGNP